MSTQDSPSAGNTPFKISPTATREEIEALAVPLFADQADILDDSLRLLALHGQHYYLDDGSFPTQDELSTGCLVVGPVEADGPGDEQGRPSIIVPGLRIYVRDWKDYDTRKVVPYKLFEDVQQSSTSADEAASWLRSHALNIIVRPMLLATRWEPLNKRREPDSLRRESLGIYREAPAATTLLGGFRRALRSVTDRDRHSESHIKHALQEPTVRMWAMSPPDFGRAYDNVNQVPLYLDLQPSSHVTDPQAVDISVRGAAENMALVQPLYRQTREMIRQAEMYGQHVAELHAQVTKPNPER